MKITPPPRTAIAGATIHLRPSRASDWRRGWQIQSDWRVTRMLRAARFPPNADAVRAWFADHRRQWTAGEAFRFALWREGRMTGLCDVDEITWEIGGGVGDLGYWLEPAAWGAGLASEAAAAVRDFAFRSGLVALNSGCAADNPASARVLEKLGFRFLGEVSLVSHSRRTAIVQRRYRLERTSASEAARGPGA